MVEIRKARVEDLDCLVDFNKQMAFETEGKELNTELLTRGV